MSPDNSNSAVAAETRVDLASLFCMVGRHGPAAGLALAAAASLLLVALVVYRTVRWTRRKATTASTSADTNASAAGDGDSGSPANRPRHEPNTEDPRSSSSSVESTDGVESGLKEEDDPKVRLRRAAPASSSSAASDVRLTGDKQAASDATTVEQDSLKEAKDRKKDEKTKQEKEYFQCVSSRRVNFDLPAPRVSDSVVNDRLRRDYNTVPEIVNGTESNSEDQSDHLDPSERSCSHVSPEEEPCGVQQQAVLDLGLDDGQGCEVTGQDLGGHQKSRQTEQEEEPGLVDQDEGVISTEADQVKEKAPSGDESDSPSVELEPSHFKEPVKVDPLEEEGHPDVSPQSGAEELFTSLDKETDLTIPDSYLPSTRTEYEKSEATAEESADLHVPPSSKDQTVNGGPDSSETGEETSWSHLPSVCQEPESDHKEIIETFTETQIPVTNAGVDIAKPVMSEEIPEPDMWTLSQNRESDQTQNSEDPSDVVAQDLIPPFSQIKLQPLEQSDNLPCPGVGEESGISSMTVSPDVQDSGNEFGVIVDDMVDCDPESEETTKAQNSLFADDVVLSVFSRETTALTLHSDWTQRDPLAVNDNEDTFGHEIEDSYHSALERFMMQLAGSGLSSADEPKKLCDLKGAFEVMEIKEKKEVVRITKKAETGEENETEELYEKTEISIMEATMDNNEWIMDGNYQFPSWMSPYIAPPAKDHTNTRQRPTEDATHGVCREVHPAVQSINVTFHIHYVTHSPHQMVAVTGNQRELGNWKRHLLMERAEDGLWTAAVRLPTDSRVEWKFVVVDGGEVCRWEECDNRLLDTGCGEDLTVHKLWGVL